MAEVTVDPNLEEAEEEEESKKAKPKSVRSARPGRQPGWPPLQIWPLF